MLENRKISFIVASGALCAVLLGLFVGTLAKQKNVGFETDTTASTLSHATSTERLSEQASSTDNMQHTAPSTTTASTSSLGTVSGTVATSNAPHSARNATRTVQSLPKAVTTTSSTTAATKSSVDVPSAYPWKKAITTVFWVGEGETSENDYISNVPSAWDETWMTSFGGLDDPDMRCGYRPCAFKPKENAFYIALPYYEYGKDGEYKANVVQVPWYTKQALENGTLLKNRWVAVKHNSITCYGQWADVGPFEEDDLAYVFGTAQTPKNTFDTKAGLDVSPAMRDCLGMDDVGTTYWRFVDGAAVPKGPWSETITGS